MAKKSFKADVQPTGTIEDAALSTAHQATESEKGQAIAPETRGADAATLPGGFIHCGTQIAVMVGQVVPGGVGLTQIRIDGMLPILTRESWCGMYDQLIAKIQEAALA